MFFEVEIASWSDKFAFTSEEQAMLRERAISSVAFQENGCLRYGTVIVDGETLALLIRFEPKVLRAISRGAAAAFAQTEQRASTVINERCHVVVPGSGTLEIDEVLAHVDYCSEQLQKRLDEGWRILAVCVQPDQRRPDYVLCRKGRSR